MSENAPNSDKFQQAWKADAAQTRVSVDPGLLHAEVQRNQQDFRSKVFWKDFSEVLLAMSMVPLWFYLGFRFSLPWTWYLVVPAIIWGAAFIVVDRRRHPQKPSEPDESVIDCVQNSLVEVEHQIRLRRNIFWWYLLPYSIPIMAFFVHVCWMSASVWWEFVIGASAFGLFLFVVYGFSYYMNQWAVRKELEPRRKELLALISTLQDETGTSHENEDGKSNVPPAAISASVSPSSPFANMSPRSRLIRTIIGSVGFVLILSLVIPILEFAKRMSTPQFTTSSYEGATQSAGPDGEALAKPVADLREEHKLVSLAAMVMIDGKVQAAVADGERKIGSEVPVEIGDRWHLGSITKSITATMIARLVESGKLQWSDTIGEIFPNESVHEKWKSATVRQLLTHTAGAPPNFSLGVKLKKPKLGDDCKKARRTAVLGVLKKSPAYSPGEKRVYSNVGFTIAGAVAEEVTGIPWSKLVQREVYEPLKLTSAGFGPPKSPSNTLPQPRGHRAGIAGKAAMGDDADNTFIMGPAGIAHMTLEDLCTYATEHLRGHLGKGTLLSADTYAFLHKPELENYACGWVRQKTRRAIPQPLYWHNGSNTMWYALVVFVPEAKTVVAVASNDGDLRNGEAAAWSIVNRQFASDEVVYAKKSPFAAVRWKESLPEVKVGDEWFRLVSLDGQSATDIVAFSKQTYRGQWQKRFEEDLVELLSRMGHAPEDAVTLVVQSVETGEETTLEKVAMTKEYRSAIYDAGLKRETAMP